MEEVIFWKKQKEREGGGGERRLTSCFQVPGVQEVSNLLVWQLDQTTSLATAHITIREDSITSFASTANVIASRLKQFGIRSIALQPTTTQRRPHQEVEEGLKSS